MAKKREKLKRPQNKKKSAKRGGKNLSILLLEPFIPLEIPRTILILIEWRLNNLSVLYENITYQE